MKGIATARAIYVDGSPRSRTCYVLRVGWVQEHMGGDLHSRRIPSRTMAMQHLELRWYGDWRWRVTSDRAGFALWCGPIAAYWWRRMAPVL